MRFVGKAIYENSKYRVEFLAFFHPVFFNKEISESCELLPDCHAQ